MSTEQVTFVVDDVVKQYSEKDAAARPEPRTDMFFEWKTSVPTLVTSKAGYLQLSFKADALDAKGGTMFTKFLNVALPVAFKGVSPGDWAKGIYTSTMKALLTEVAPYTEIAEDPATGKKIYLNNGEALSKEAFDAANKAQAEAINGLLDNLLNPDTMSSALEGLGNRYFFAKLKTSKDGQYTNIGTLLGHKPKEEVVYDRKAAFGRAG